MDIPGDVLEQFFQKMHIGGAIFTGDLTLRVANAAWIEVVSQCFGTIPAAFTAGASLFSLLPGSKPQLKPLVERVMSGQATREEAVPLTRNGKLFYWNIELIPAVHDAEPAGFLMVINDVTRRKRGEEELFAAQNALFTLMSNLPGMAYRGQHNPARLMELVNANARELTGYPPETFCAPAGSGFGALIHIEDRPQVWETLEAAVDRKQPFEIVYRIHTRDQTIKWVMERGGPILSPDNQIVALEGFILDITERVLSQQLLERRVADRTHKLSTMYEVMAAAADASDLPTIMANILALVLQAVHAQSGGILLLNEESAVLEMVAEHNWPLGLATGRIGQPAAGEGLWQMIKNQPMVTGDQPGLPGRGGEETPAEGPILATLPIAAWQRQVGAMVIIRHGERPFSEADLALLASTADQLGTSIENDRLRQESDRFLVLQERHRLARELHDAVTHTLYSLTLFAEVTQRFAGRGELEQVRQYSEKMQESAQQSLREMRLLLHNLRPPALEKLGLVGAIQHRLDAVEKRSAINYQLIADGEAVGDLPQAVEETLWHVAEEALNNALKHGDCSRLTVKIGRSGERVRLEIEDDGRGFDPQAVGSGGQGLGNMREWLELLDGRFEVESGPGTRIAAEVDLSRIPAARPARPRRNRE